MFGRRLAVTTVKAKRNPDDISADTMDFEEIADLSRDTISGTAEDLAKVVVLTATALTALRITEHVVKYFLR